MADAKSVVYSISSDLIAYKEWSGSNKLDARSFVSFLKGESPKEMTCFPVPNKDDLENDYQIIKSKLESKYFDLIPMICGIKQKDFNKMSDKNKLQFVEEGYRLCVLRNKM